MIHLLDSTLETLLMHELPADLVSPDGPTPVTVSFATPDSQFPPTAVTLPAIDLFLYDVRENRDLRSSEWIVERQTGGQVSRRRPPVRVDCAYLVTAWASDGSPDPAGDEHRLLGEVMRVLLRHPTIPEAALDAGLQGQQPALPTISLRDGRLQGPSDLWQALGGKPRAALHYTVTLSIEPEAPTTAPLVTENVVKTRQEGDLV